MARARQARATQTRTKIILAGAEEFEEYGFFGASMSRIVSRAETTMGAVYFHFSSKKDLARAVIDEYGRSLSFPIGESGLQLLVDINMHLTRQMRTNIIFRAAVRLAVEYKNIGVPERKLDELWVACFQEQLKAAADRGELLPGTDTAGFSRLLVNAYTGTQWVSQFITRRDDFSEEITQMLRLLLPVIATAETIARLDLTPTRGHKNA